MDEKQEAQATIAGLIVQATSLVRRAEDIAKSHQLTEQLTLDLSPVPVYRVGCRVKGEAETQIYEIEALTIESAIDVVKTNVPGTTVVLAVLLKGAMND